MTIDEFTIKVSASKIPTLKEQEDMKHIIHAGQFWKSCKKCLVWYRRWLKTT